MPCNRSRSLLRWLLPRTNNDVSPLESGVRQLFLIVVGRAGSWIDERVCPNFIFLLCKMTGKTEKHRQDLLLLLLLSSPLLCLYHHC